MIEAALPIVSTALPTQLMKGQQYSLGIDVGVRRRPGPEVLRAGVHQDDQRATVYRLPVRVHVQLLVDKPESPNSGDDAGDGDEARVPAKQPAVRSAAHVIIQVLPQRAEPHLETVPAGPVSLDWGTDGYTGTDNALTGLILLVQPITSPTASLTVTVTATTKTGPMTDHVLLSVTTVTFSFGSSTSAEVTMSKQEAGIVEFAFAVTSNVAEWQAVALDAQNVTFVPMIQLRLQQPATNLYAGINNMLVVALVADAALRAVDTTTAMSYTVNVDSSDTTLLVAQPATMTWTPRSNLTQFVYLLGVGATPSVTFRFRLSGVSAKYVGSLPAPQTVAVLEPLLVRRSASPTSIYVGAVNRVQLFVTVPVRDGTLTTFTVRVSITGDSSAFSIEPSVLRWTSANTSWQNTASFWVSGVYSSGIANQITYTLVEGPTWAVMQPVTAAETRLGTQVLDLQSLALLPDLRLFEIFNGLQYVIAYSPATVLVRCQSQSPQDVGVATTGGNITLTPFTPGTSKINCTVNDTTFGDVPVLQVKSLACKQVSTSTAVVYTYPGGCVVCFLYTLSRPTGWEFLSSSPT